MDWSEGWDIDARRGEEVREDVDFLCMLAASPCEQVVVERQKQGNR